MRSLNIFRDCKAPLIVVVRDMAFNNSDCKVFECHLEELGKHSSRAA